VAPTQHAGNYITYTQSLAVCCC